MRKAVKAVIALAILLLTFTSCQQRYIFLPIPGIDDNEPYVEIPETPTIPDVGESKTKNLEAKEYSYSDISEMITNGAKKFVGAGAEQTIIDLSSENSTVRISDDLILEDLTVKGSVSEEGTDKTTPQGIVVSNQTKEINIYLKGVTLENFGHGISSGFSKDVYDDSPKSIYKTNLYIIDSTFDNCLKGLYINNLGTLKVFNSRFSRMGKLSEDGDDPTTRSGSAFDINQFAKGDEIIFYNSTFTECGGAGTSGAIKIKVRGGSEETATDVPETTTGSFESVLIQSCTFNNANDRDLILGTTGNRDNDKKPCTYPQPLARNTRIIDTQLNVVDESGNGYTLSSFAGN